MRADDPPERPKRAKRTGIAGPNRVYIDGHGRVERSFEQISFPKDKSDIEIYIAERFISVANSKLSDGRSIPFFHSLRRNEENDFDFGIMQGNIRAHLELTEIVSPTKMRTERGYPTSIDYNPVKFARDIHDNILRKSEHYGNTSEVIFLLAYSTHWSFVPSDSTIVCLRAMLHRSSPIFKAVFGFALHDDKEGEVRWLYPVPASLRPREALWRLRDNTVFALDPREWSVLSSALSQGVGDIGEPDCTARPTDNG